MWEDWQDYARKRGIETGGFRSQAGTPASVLDFFKGNSPSEPTAAQEKPAVRERCRRSPGLIYQPGNEEMHRINCKSRQCPYCGKFWAHAWRLSLKARFEAAAVMGYPAPKRCVTLTTAYDPGFAKMTRAIGYFWEYLRKCFPGVQYWGCVEYNQAQTQPHLHFILSNDRYIDRHAIKTWWWLAQQRAGFTKLAFITQIAKIKGDMAQYLNKYLTKQTGGKDEIPDRAKWKGRYIRYSKLFFSYRNEAGELKPVQRQAQLAAIRLNIYLIGLAEKVMDGSDPDAPRWGFDRYFSIYSHRPADQRAFIARSHQEYERLQYAVTRKWEPLDDRARAEPVKLNQLTFGKEVYYAEIQNQEGRTDPTNEALESVEVLFWFEWARCLQAGEPSARQTSRTSA